MKFNCFNLPQSLPGVASRGAFGGGVRIFLAALAVMFIASCSSSSDAPVPLPVPLPVPVPISSMTVSPNPLSFGIVPLNIEQTMSLTVNNTGAITATGVAINTLSGEFTRTTTCTDTLAAGASCIVAVMFRPTEARLYTADLRVTSANGGEAIAILSGSGTVAPIPVITVDNASLAFGDVVVNSPKTMSVKVSNTGNAPTTDLNMSLQIPNGAFSIDSAGSTCTDILGVNASCDIAVVFMPTALGDNAGNLTIALTGIESITIPITGKGATFAIAKIYPNQPGIFPNYTFGLGNDGKLYAWGSNDNGTLGVDSADVTSPTSVPTAVKVPDGVAFEDIYAGLYHVIAKDKDGKLYAWGRNDAGQLGVNDIIDKYKPTPVVTPAGVKFTNVYMGTGHTIATTNTGKLYAWGFNDDGQLGLGHQEIQTEPIEMPFPNSNVTSFTHIYNSAFYTLAEGSDGNLYAWGYNAQGQLGTGDTNHRLAPVKVDYPPGVIRYKKVFNGVYHVGAISNDNQMYMWGENDRGQLGIMSTESKMLPTRVTMPQDVTFTEVYLGLGYTLAIGSDGKLYGWGENGGGELGIGSTDNKNIPTTNLADIKTYTNLYCVSVYCFAKSVDNKFYAWGENPFGQLGIGGHLPQDKPMPIVMPDAVVSFSTFYLGEYFSFAKGSDGKYYGWGYNAHGQLGLNDTADRDTPTELK